ncbi:MAG: CDP-glucose 4,6-dehydratase [Bdellovibrionales bacterium RIFCSPHIGHO2_01_FULL_40_29]|nr:MAG: CDP-glucose 4,6-dehydratase [Bdellovibrionales bacterium RIFCSPHIGHO2_01_FULL_40_29]OFZ34600.1 MAG: CDP-glucose 4,6-dehydratase [Bdellovibrionales bacterium RIFCSPHIGHO2_02_FULL_40_15]
MAKNVVNPNFWSGKKVFLTGHTGFKGSWTSLWLTKAGANVTGYALAAPTNPSLFEEAGVAKNMDSRVGDIRDLENLKKVVCEVKPEIVIHMAAQPLVRYSYNNPVETYMTNVMGTVHLFEAVRAAKSVKTVLNVTSDKCYENHERLAGYREDEAMGGHDPYSNSKGCSELITSAYRKSFFAKEDVLVASGRAGNVIGGGDWAEDRLVPDIVRSVLNNKKLIIRNPKSLRPWQHVLEPVGGYLSLTEHLFNHGDKFAEGFNFGPHVDESCDVENIIIKMNSYWNQKIQYEIIRSETQLHEAHFLKLDCAKANSTLGWNPCWSVEQALEKTVQWHLQRIDGRPVQEICLEQILQYEKA